MESSPVDLAAQEKWLEFTHFKNEMFRHTHTEISPWIIVRGTEREDTRVQAMRYVLNLLDYPDRSTKILSHDPSKVFSWKANY